MYCIISNELSDVTTKVEFTHMDRSYQDVMICDGETHLLDHDEYGREIREAMNEDVVFMKKEYETTTLWIRRGR